MTRTYHRRTLVELLRLAAIGWWQDKAPRIGASLAYYTLFAIAPILLIAIGVAGLVFGTDVVRTQLVTQISGMLGSDAGTAAQTMLSTATPNGSRLIITVMGIIGLFVTSTGAFLELQSALNTIWRVKPDPRASFGEMLRNRLRAFAILVAIGFLLLVSLMVSTGLAATGKWIGTATGFAPAVMVLVNIFVSVILIAVLFALIFRVLPDADLRWSHVWKAALITSVLFGVGKELIGAYLGRGKIGASFGGAGSVVVIMVWVYYAAQIVIFGAEFARVEAGRGIEKLEK